MSVTSSPETKLTQSPAELPAHQVRSNPPIPRLDPVRVRASDPPVRPIGSGSCPSSLRSTGVGPPFFTHLCCYFLPGSRRGPKRDHPLPPASLPHRPAPRCRLQGVPSGERPSLQGPPARAARTGNQFRRRPVPPGPLLPHGSPRYCCWRAANCLPPLPVLRGVHTIAASPKRTGAPRLGHSSGTLRPGLRAPSKGPLDNVTQRAPGSPEVFSRTGTASRESALPPTQGLPGDGPSLQGPVGSSLRLVLPPGDSSEACRRTSRARWRTSRVRPSRSAFFFYRRLRWGSAPPSSRPAPAAMLFASVGTAPQDHRGSAAATNPAFCSASVRAPTGATAVAAGRPKTTITLGG
ncbi:hypothetical protein NDU88_008131 [Pleurodeles waltl]|uniref:Basic proline-rich protein-like n=1 Tax=Pleurodeles waltl TaxID=8319 RepID=A0AAV7VVH5_PLEWA|nr:hypothetical protein NDU88_008131 [Pleurodeles waltl]